MRPVGALHPICTQKFYNEIFLIMFRRLSFKEMNAKWNYMQEIITFTYYLSNNSNFERCGNNFARNKIIVLLWLCKCAAMLTIDYTNVLRYLTNMSIADMRYS